MMRWSLLLTAILGLSTIVGEARATETPKGEERLAARDAIRYRCPMPDHEAVYEQPGTCPECGMKLVSTESLRTQLKKVAILVFDGVQIIDSMGPYEVFGQAQWTVY